MKECLCQMFGPPYWPLPLDQLPALIRFHEIQAGDVFLLEDQIRVQTLSDATIRAEKRFARTSAT